MKDGTLGLRRRKGMAVKLEQLKVDKDGNIHSVDSEIKKNKKTADKIINQHTPTRASGTVLNVSHCVFYKVVSVGFNTLRYDASVGVLNPPHE